MRPVVFLDIDDVIAINLHYNSYQVMAALKSENWEWPELWSELVFSVGRANLSTLHYEFLPSYVISSSWTRYLKQEQIQQIFRKCGLEFIADALHVCWTTPKNEYSSRSDELIEWIAKHRKAGQPLLILDDYNSGFDLVESPLYQQGLVVLCEPSIGFISEKLVAAQRLLRAQLL
ncbi:HAD domain-containing protein [Pseudoduganella umbonata]|uniref:HAD family hydrolase n=1 Tax=Pseudoduganella umbonata TaxID=864828 RepID=A0A4P8HK47_9BURK|nr:HAD domain-containing protein [Pseudoduganella umbonata]MBB3219995.1 hypothetical protein [Pseudoduganella umbonata]QCP10003.1 hypothetical protein FCL38_05880 [Pseudoduganella umbonata]